MKKIIIAIDGLSSTGKSTLAKQLAAKLNYIYVDTGAMYRAVTFYAMEQQFIGSDFFHKEQLITSLESISLTFKYHSELGFAAMYLNTKNVEKEIRTLEVSQYVSKIATISEVRKKLVSAQQLMGKDKGIVMDGRDIGTVVFPEAALKIYMTASADKRAERRYKELIERGDAVSYKDILHNVEERDRIDSTREDSPLIRAADAIPIDNTDMGLAEQFTYIMSLVQDKIG